MYEMYDKTVDYSIAPEASQQDSPFFNSAYDAPGTAPPSKASDKYQLTLSESTFLPPVFIDAPVASSTTGAAATKAEATLVEETDFFSGCWNVISDLAEGAYEEIVENPYETAVKVVVGVAVGAAAVFVAPVVLVGAAVGAAVGTGYEVYEHGGEWCDNIDKVANPEDYTAAEVEEAHKAVKGMGAVVADVALGAATGVAGSALAGVVTSAVRGAASAEASSVVSGAAKGTAEVEVKAAVEYGTARAATADSAAGTAATRPFPAEPPSGGKYIEIKVPKKDEFDPNLPLNEREIEELAGPQVSMAVEETTFQIASKEAWAAELEALSTTGAAVRVAQTANNWAVAIEERLAAGELLTKELADRAFAWVNVDDCFNWSVASVLKDAWVHGKQLNDWYEF